MSVNSDNEELLDNDPTDELPVLSEALLAPEDHVHELHGDDTAEQTALYHQPLEETVEHTSALHAPSGDVAAQSTRLRALEADVARLLEQCSDLERQSAAKDALVAKLTDELEVVRLELETARHELDHAGATLAEQRAKLAQQAASEERLRSYEDEITALKSYIADRRKQWEDAQALAESQATRIAELEWEVEQRLTRQQGAEQLAHSESSRAEALRAELIAVSRQLEARERDAGTLQLVAQMTEEIERNRAQIDAQRSELSAKTSELRRLAEESDDLRVELMNSRAAHELASGDLRRLERTLLDKSRALEARNERIETLERELDQQRGTLHGFNDLQASMPSLEANASENMGEPDHSERQALGAPALVCLTGDKPHQYVLYKTVMTIGRSAHCDIQVLTHFTSREHARLTIKPDGVLIEDLGSTNGVFVNSVRVDRHALQHSDLVTVGETQFRFLERVSH